MQQKDQLLTLVLDANDELKKKLEARNVNTPAMSVPGTAATVDREHGITTLKAENQSLKTENSDLKAESQSLKTENQSLKTKNQSLKTENQSLKTECRTLTLEYKTLEDKNRALAARVEDLDLKKSSMESYMLHKANELRSFTDDITDRVNGAGRFQDLDDPYTIAQVYVPVKKEP
ncbi:hypothetical protein BJ166DRAFT_592623 [Pestalotiopsis sp. NC0098]|nr:hypothetical protein BJ166DRAFT_592623 [Pestalotiopsis sp. NC0098]